MNTRQMLAALVAAGVLGTAVVAAEEPGTEPTMEERGEHAKAALKDAWLDGRLETTFLFNEQLNSFDITTDVEDGIVRLAGTVQSEVERDLAVEIASSIDGVRGVENELTVDASRTAGSGDSDASREARGFRQAVVDATLTARIKSKLLADGDVGGLSVDVDSRNGAVTLTGKVDSEEEKVRVLSIARDTSGTSSVEDRLTVEGAEEAE